MMKPLKPKSKRFLITGINGLLGWNLFQEAKQKHDVKATYWKNHKKLEGDHLFRIDPNALHEFSDYAARTNPDYFIHAWSMCDLDVCEMVPEAAYAINIEGTKQMIRAARRIRDLKKFVYISTDHVFNGDRGFYVESDMPRPKHIYGRSKRLAEILIENSGLPYLIIRPALVIGKSLQGNIGPRDFLLSRVKKKLPFHLFTDELRTPIRAESFTKKVIEAVLSEKRGVLHVTGTEVMSRFQIATNLAKEHGYSTENLFPRLRKEDRWAHIRPHHLTLASNYST